MRKAHGRYLAIVLLLSLMGSACATTGGQNGLSGGNPDRIAPEQMEEAAQQHDTAYTVVQNLRPLWLRKRGRSSISNEGEILVYVDGSRYGTPSDLRSIPAMNVESMRFLSPAEATNRYGAGHQDGVILVRTKG